MVSNFIIYFGLCAKCPLLLQTLYSQLILLGYTKIILITQNQVVSQTGRGRNNCLTKKAMIQTRLKSVGVLPLTSAAVESGL